MLIFEIPIALNDSIDAIHQIGQNTFNTAENTKFGIVALITFIVSLATLFFAILTYISQKATQRNTSRLNKNEMFPIFIVIISKLYYSFVNAVAIKIKMEEIDYNAYPSELVLDDMKVDIEYFSPHILIGLKDEDLRTSLFILNGIKKYNKNIEIYKEHLKDAHIGKENKYNDLMALLRNIVNMINEVNLLQNMICFSKRDRKNYILNLLTIMSNYAKHLNSYEGTRKELPYKTTIFKDLFSEYWGEKMDTLDRITLDKINYDFLENLRVQLGKDKYNIERIQMINII